MTRYKCSVKDGELTIKSKLGGDEQINPRELELLSGGGIRGVMKVKKGSFGKLIFTAPAAEPLKRYLMNGLTKEEFASVVAQFVRVLMELDRYALQMRNLELYVEGVYITPVTRELMFIYRPVVNKVAGCDLNGFIRSLIEFATFSTLQDRAYVAELESILRDIEKFPPKTMSDYVCRLDKATYDRELARMDGSQQQAQYAPPQNGWGAPAPEQLGGGYAAPFDQPQGFANGWGNAQTPDNEETTYSGFDQFAPSMPQQPSFSPQNFQSEWAEEPTGIDNSYDGTDNGYWAPQRPAQGSTPNYEEMMTGLWAEGGQNPAPAPEPAPEPAPAPEPEPAETPQWMKNDPPYSPPVSGAENKFEPEMPTTVDDGAAPFSPPPQPAADYDEATNIDFSYGGYNEPPQQSSFGEAPGAYAQPRQPEPAQDFDEPLTGFMDDYQPPEPSYSEPVSRKPQQSAYDEPPTGFMDDYQPESKRGSRRFEPAPAPAPEPRRSAPVVRATLERCGTGDVYTIKQDEVLIGKDRLGADIYIDGNPAVSRRHALITSRGGRFYITDMRSLNHTFVNGREIRAEQEFEIKDGSRLCLADENFIFRIR